MSGVRGVEEGPWEGPGDAWGGAAGQRGCTGWVTYPAGGPETAGLGAHPRDGCCELRSPGLHPGPSTAAGASLWARTAGAPGGRGGNACTPSQLIRPVASLGVVFCVEKSRETSLCGTECAWRRSPGTGLGPALHSSTWGPAHPAAHLGKPASGVDCRWGSGRHPHGPVFQACRVPRASSLELAPPLGREGCRWSQAVPSLLGTCAPLPPPTLGLCPLGLPVQGKPGDPRELPLTTAGPEGPAVA